jgi:predicted esterase
MQKMWKRAWAGWLQISALASLTLFSRTANAAEPSVRGAVTGIELDAVSVTHNNVTTSERMATLWFTERVPGKYMLRFTLPREGGTLWIPSCGRRERVYLASAGGTLPVAMPDAGPLRTVIAAGGAATELVIEGQVSTYERRVACGGAPRIGTPSATQSGFMDVTFSSTRKAACRGDCAPGRALAYVPASVAVHPDVPAPLLMGVHPWNGSQYTYAAYRTLIDAADTEGLVLLFPDGLGNSLYLADAEAEAMQALDTLTTMIKIDPLRTSIWGASMGGQGAATIGFHHPDRFAFVGSFFGDARITPTGYARSYFPKPELARAVNPADAGDNARYLHTLLIHGDSDKMSPVAESNVLSAELAARGYSVNYVRPAGRGHEGRMVEDFMQYVVRDALAARAPRFPSRVSYRAMRASDRGAYGVQIERLAPASEAFADIEYLADTGTWRMHAAENVKSLTLADGALGCAGACFAALPARVAVAGRTVVVQASKLAP